MYSLVIADDESLIREALTKTVDWNSLGVSVDGTFSNGKEIVEYLENHRPDIIISDIKMPFMDGVELLSYIHKHKLEIKVILLTGYAEFDYLKQAMRYGVFDYLLKPIQREELEQAVLRCMNSIEGERNLSQLVEEKNEADRRALFAGCLLGTAGSREQELLLQGIHTYGLLVFIYDFTEEQLRRQKAYLERMERFMKSSFVTKQKEDNKIDAILAEFQPDTQCLFVASMDEDKPMTNMDIRRWADIIYEYLADEGQREEIPLTMTVCYKACDRDIETLSANYQQLSETLRQRHILGNNRILECSGDSKTAEDVRMLAYPADEILEHIRCGQAELVKRDIHEVYENLLGGKSFVSLGAVQNLSMELAITIFRLQQSGSQQVSFLYFLNELQELKTVEELKNKIQGLALSVCQENMGKYQPRQAILAEEAKKLIEKEYADPTLGLEMVSDKLHVSAAYLSVVLKRVFGVNFSAYLTNIRMNQAKELLKQEHFKLQNVAEAVGYSSSQYFSFCFKKYTGMTPSQFREMANKSV